MKYLLGINVGGGALKATPLSEDRVICAAVINRKNSCLSAFSDVLAAEWRLL